MCTSDLHAAIWPFDYAEDTEDPSRSLSCLAPVIEKARTGHPASCLFDLGDMLQGTALADRVSEVEDVSAHPVITAMNMLGYDAATLGNHDFDYGLGLLDMALATARFPMIQTNLDRRTASGNAPVTGCPYLVLDRHVTDTDGQLHPVKLGLLGIAPPQTTLWNASALNGAVMAQDAVRAVADALPRLRAEGADLVIILCHSGLGDGQDTPMAENVARRIAQLDGVDVLLTGHSHGHLPGPDFEDVPGVDATRAAIHGKPALMPGSNGRWLGVLDLELARDGTRWRVADHRAELREVSAQDHSPDRGILTATRDWHLHTREVLSAPVAQIRTHLDTHFAMAGHAPALRLLADAQIWAARQLVDGTGLADLPILSAIAPFRLGGRAGPGGFVDLPPGPLLARHLLNLAPFPNRLCVFKISGAEIRRWLERSASAFQQVAEGAQDQPLLVSGAPGYNLDTVYGLTYRIDLARPASFNPLTGARVTHQGPGRIRDLTRFGEPVRDTDCFAMVTNAYRACGGGHYRQDRDLDGMLCSDATLRQCLTLYLQKQAEIAVTPEPAWSFAPMNSSVLLETGPLADVARAGDLRPHLTNLGKARTGFRHVRLDLANLPPLHADAGNRRDALASPAHGA